MKTFLTRAILLSASFASIALLSPCLGQADRESVPYDFHRTINGSKFSFVMLVPQDLLSLHPTAKVDKKLRKKYPCSGLYSDEDSGNPIWTVTWYSPNIYPAPDGIHLAKLLVWPEKDQYDTVGVTFYRNGQKMQEFTIKQLVADIDTLPLSASHFWWLRSAQWDEYGLFVLETLAGDKRVFNPSRMKGPPLTEKNVSCKVQSIEK